MFKKFTGDDHFPYKVELHVHLDGTMRPQTIFETAKRRGIQLPTKTVAELHDYLLVKKTQDLETLLRSFRTFMPVVAGDRDAVYRMAYEFCETCSKYNIKYAEARYSPHLLANTFAKPYYALETGSYSPRDVVTTVSEALVNGCRDFNVNVKSILCCYRDTPAWSLEVAELCRDFKADGVVGIDVAGPEHLCGKDSPHIAAYLDAERNGIHRTAHAGEVTPAETIYEALDDMHAERIGHGYSCINNADLYRRVKRDRIHLETCPISSIMTGGAPNGKINHPITRLAQDGVNFSISTDDPNVLDNNILDDYSVAMDMGLTRQQIIQSIFNAAQSSFSSDKEKKVMLEELTKVYGDQSV
ncbi:hypothetical protein SNE40_006092 [Patella caerulea]|uniref:Adenosine deaminase n=1 Tax=Patella caerulea TaxID=87958 RepID=A0AAN8PVM9_PATCE